MIRLARAIAILIPVAAWSARPAHGQLPDTAAAEVRLIPPPSWVTPVKWDRGGPAQGNSGTQAIRYLLYDWQVEVDEEQEYTHVAVLLLNETGVEDYGSLSIRFDPDYQELWLHHVRVHREEEVLERLEPSKVKVIQPESELDWNIYSGEKTATIVLEDLRVGDVLEYAFTTRGRNPVLADHYSTRFLTQWSLPVDRQFYRVVCSVDRKLHLRNHVTDVQAEIQSGADGREFVWTLGEQPALDIEDYLPASYEPCPYVELSDYHNWGKVVEWALELYPRDESLITAELRELISGWEAVEDSPAERARMALQFVQNDVRYMSVVLGPDSLRPSPPPQTLERRFGDCKDKAYLLCVLLEAMGIEAYPVLVNSGIRSAVERRLPSPLAFDHLIVKILLDGEVAWVDPTLQHQRGSIFRRHVSPYGWGLVIRPGGNRLEAVQPPANLESFQQVTSEFTLSSHSAPAFLEVKTVFFGVEADNMRESLSRNEIEGLGQSYVNFYSRYYPKIRAKGPPQVEEGSSESTITLIERYEIPDLWELEDSDGKWYAYFYPDSIYSMLPDPSRRLRKMPLAIPFPRRRKQTIFVHLPDDGWDIPSATTFVDGPGFRFRCVQRLLGRTVSLIYECETTASEIEPESVAEYLEKLEKMEDQLGYSLYRSEEGAVLPSGWHVNWLMVAISGLYGLLLLGGAVWLIRRSLRPRSSPPPIPQPGEERLQGLGGWLIIVGLGVCLSPLRLVATMFSEGSTYFSADVWQEVAMPQGGSYHPLFGPLLVGELLANMALLVISICLVYLFFSKSRLFPNVFIGMLVFLLLVFIGGEIVAQQIPHLADPSGARSGSQVGGAVLAAMIWGPYVLLSRRVRLTFIR